MGVTFIKPRSVLRALQGLLGCKDLTEVDSSLVTAGQEGVGESSRFQDKWWCDSWVVAEPSDVLV